MANDFPAMEDFNEGGQALRYNKGKKQWALVDFKSLEPMVEVLDYGKSKYTLTKSFNILSLFQLCLKPEFATTVKIVSQLSHEAFVRPVIEKLPLNMVHVQDVANIQQLVRNLCVDHVVSTSESILLVKNPLELESTNKSIETDLKTKKKKDLEKKKEEIIPNMLKRLSEETFSGDLLTTESAKSFTSQKFLKDVRSANPLQDYTLTIVIQQENTEEFCVVNAITPLDCLMTTLNYLEMQSIISKNLIIDKGLITISGKDNWKKGMPVTQVSESLLRHMFAFLSGEDKDPESGIDHLGHVMCNAMFLSYIMREKKQYDDRGYEDPSK